MCHLTTDTDLYFEPFTPTTGLASKASNCMYSVLHRSLFGWAVRCILSFRYVAPVVESSCYELLPDKKWECLGCRTCDSRSSVTLLLLLIFDRFLDSAILRSRADFYSAFLNIHRSVALTTLTWLVPYESAAVSAHSVYTIQQQQQQ